MAVDARDLQIVRDEVHAVAERIGQLENRFEGEVEFREAMSDVVDRLEIDVSALQTDVHSVKATVEVVKGEVRDLRADVKQADAVAAERHKAIMDSVQALRDGITIPAKFFWPLLIAALGGGWLGGAGIREAVAAVAGG